MQHTISTSAWVHLSSETRSRIRSLFNIPRSSHVVVNDGYMETDGTTVEDLKHLTVEKMRDHLKEDSGDMHFLFDKLVSRIQGEIEGKVLAEEPKKDAKTAKKNK